MTYTQITLYISHEKEGRRCENIVEMHFFSDWSEDAIKAFAEGCSDTARSRMGLLNPEVECAVVNKEWSTPPAWIA